MQVALEFKVQPKKMENNKAHVSNFGAGGKLDCYLASSRGKGDLSGSTIKRGAVVYNADYGNCAFISRLVAGITIALPPQSTTGFGWGPLSTFVQVFNAPWAVFISTWQLYPCSKFYLVHFSG